MVEAATGDEPHAPVAHPDSNFCFTSPWDLRTLVFHRNVWHLTSMSGSRISIHRTNRKHAKYLVSDTMRSCTLLLTLLQHCAPSFAQNRFVMYITHVHRYVCYVFHLIMYKISFLCWLGQHYWVCDFPTPPIWNYIPKVCLCRFDVCNMTPEVICWLICAILCIQGMCMNVLCIWHVNSTSYSNTNAFFCGTSHQVCTWLFYVYNNIMHSQRRSD